MESLLSYINWNVNPEIFRIGSFAVRWYGLLFVSSFIFGFFLLKKVWEREGYPIETLDKLTMYMMVSTIIGARLGHCLFYQPGYYLSHPLEILKIWEGGLASHGAALGIIIGIYIFVRKYKQFRFLWVIDRVVLVVALSGFFIRSGNLMNSEIYGKPTYSSFGFVYGLDASKEIGKDPWVKSVKYEKNNFTTLVNGNSVPFSMKIVFNKNADNLQLIKYFHFL